MEIGRAVGSEQVAEVERERWVGDAVAIGVVRGQIVIAPTLIFGRLEEEQIDPVGRSGAVLDPVGRFGRNLDGSVENAVESIFGDAVLEEFLQHCRDGGDSEWTAHRAPSFRCLR
ncbi:MAG: hypothetical protein Udaeo2_05830 [Candidatus Udaeobacter sp.]|nr:MAG: hypothetical protein Udaeo2_05830 [Candidatus Udaeobacter sp.]